jgi:hypothetical protein
MASKPTDGNALNGIESYPDLAKLIDHCRQLAGGRDMPHRNDFRASKVRWMFAHLYLVDVVDGGADYRCRLWGQFWETIFGINLQGKSLSDLEQTGNLLHLRAEYDAIVAARCIRFRAGQVIWRDNTSADYARVIVPFAGDDGHVSMLLSAATCGKSIEDLVFFKGLGVPRFEYRLG